MDHKFYSFYFHFRHRITQWELSILKTHLEEKKTTITNPSQTGVQLGNTMFAKHGVKLSKSKCTLWLCWSIMVFCGLECNSMVEYFSTTQIQNGIIRGLNLELIYTKHRTTEPLWQHTPYTQHLEVEARELWIWGQPGQEIQDEPGLYSRYCHKKTNKQNGKYKIICFNTPLKQANNSKPSHRRRDSQKVKSKKTAHNPMSCPRPQHWNRGPTSTRPQEAETTQKDTIKSEWGRSAHGPRTAAAQAIKCHEHSGNNVGYFT